ncbi:MAG: hypothetical protein Q6373_013900 [Candidatus Sigynarchaeota archaeon]
MAFENEIVLITRVCLIGVYFYMFWFFRNNFLKSKAAGFINKFFIGYAFFFLVLFGFQVGYAFTEVGDYFNLFPTDWIRGNFPGYGDKVIMAPVLFLYNLVKPIFLLGISSLMLLIAGQVYPLELTLNWNKIIITKYLLLVALGVMLIFIPLLTWTTYSFIILLAAILGVIIGLLMNIGVNVKIARVSTGELRRRSISIIFASILFYMGFIWTLEIKEISLGDFAWDTVFGSVLQAISAVLYRQGLRITPTESDIARSLALKPRNRFLLYFLGVIVAFFVFLIVARALYPDEFTMLDKTVSTLGVYAENPNGWYFFTAALWVAGIGLVPYYIVLLKLLRPTNKVLAVIMFILYLLTSIGLVMAGLFQEDSAYRNLHLISAYIGFGGFFLAGIFTWILVGMFFKQQQTRKWHIAGYLTAIITLSVGAGLFLFHLIVVGEYSGGSYGPFLGFAFTEWLLVFTIFVDKLLIGLVVASFLVRHQSL